MKVLISIFVIAGLLFGAELTVNAAQNDLPDQPLYALKTWSEDVSLGFQKNPEEKVNRLMELAQVRVQEMAQLNDVGKPVSNQVGLRLEQHIQQALQICSTLDDQTMHQALMQVRDRLQEQDREIEQLQLRSNPDSQPVLEQTREMLQRRLQLVNAGLLDYVMFRNAARNGFRHGPDVQCDPGQCSPPAPTGTGQQHGQPTMTPHASNTQSGGLNTATAGPNPGSGSTNATLINPNMTPGGSNMNPGGNNPGGGGNMNGPGSGSGGGGGMGGNGSGSGGGGGGKRP